MNWLFTLLILLVCYYVWHHLNRKKEQRQNALKRLGHWGHPKTEDFDLHKIKSYTQNAPLQEAPFQVIKDQENNDLDLDEVFMFLDRTVTPIGQQFLYHRLHTVQRPDTSSSTSILEKEFEKNQSIREEIHTLLQRLNTREMHYFHYLFTHPIPLFNRQYKLAVALGLINTVLLFLMWLHPLFSVLFLLTLPVNLLIHYKNKFRLYEYQNGITQLRSIKLVLNHLQKLPLLHPYLERQSYAILNSLTRLTHGFDTPFHANEISTLLWFPIELLKIIFNIEPILFYHFTKKITGNKQELHNAFTTIGTIELALSNASCKANQTTCTPVFHKEKHILTEDIYHPLVVPCVTNNLELKEESLVLTGSNMSGKTTFIRTIALNALLSQTLGFAFAKSFHLPFCRLHTSIRITDDLLENTSYYLKEVENIKHFLDACNSNAFNLFVLDEILKGTNTTERIAASTAILRYLNQEQNLILVSTHDLELVSLLAPARYSSYYFSESFDERNQLHFDYTIKKGVPTTTNAIRLLQLYDYPPELVKEALYIKQQVGIQKKE